MAIGHKGIVDATIVDDAGRIGMDTNLLVDCFLRFSNLCDYDMLLGGVKPCTGADVSWEERALDCFAQPHHQLIEPIEPQTEFCLGDSSSLIYVTSMISVDDSPIIIHESLNMNGFVAITTSKGKKKYIGRMSLKSISEISKLNLHIDSHFDQLQTPWTIQFQNLQKLKCVRVAALEKRKTFLIEQMPSLCFSRLLNELCHFEIRRELKVSNFANLHKSHSLYDLPGSKITLYASHVHSKCQQRFDEVHTDRIYGSTQHQTDGAKGVFKRLKNALLALIFKVSVSLHFARKYHVVIFAILLTEATSTDVHIHCTGQGVPVTSSSYPDVLIEITAPGGRMILLNFDYVSLGPADSLIITDTTKPVKTQYYYGHEGKEDQVFSPFLSRRNKLQITTVLLDRSARGFNITALCYKMPATNIWHLVDGNTPAEGFFELSTQSESGGEWMRVCEDNLSERVAEIVCGELGYAIFKEVAYENGGCQSDGSGAKCVRAPVCGEYAYRLQDCSPPSTNCTSSKAVKIKCFEPGFIGCYNHGINQLQNSSIHNTTPECVSSCRSDKVQALAIIVNDSQCFCSTANDIDLSDLTTERACTYPVYNASVGFCSKTDDVMNGYWDSNSTWFSSIVHLTCDDGYNLIGSGTLQCVPGVSPFLPQWNDSMPSCENDTSSADSTPFPIITSLSTSDYVYPRPCTTSLHRLAATDIMLIILCAVSVIFMIATIIFLSYRHKHNKHRGKGGRRCTAQSFVTSNKRSRKTEDATKHIFLSLVRETNTARRWWRHQNRMDCKQHNYPRYTDN